MPSPHFTPELVFPLPDKSPSRISDELEIPLVNGRPVYIQSAMEQSPGVITPQLVPANHTIHSKLVTPGIRNSRLNRRNQMFEATIGRNTKRPACEKFNYTSQPTQTSCVMDNGGTQTNARDSHPFTASNVFAAGIQTQPSVVDEPYSVPPHGGQAETHASMEEDDCDENIIFEDDEEEDEGYLFGGQEPDDWEANEDVDLETANEDPNEPDVPDPYDAVYANVPNVTHMLKPEDNCEHCNAEKFESEPPGFCCHSGKIHLSTHETPPGLMRLWSSSDADARHFRANIRYFNGHFSFTSMYCKLDRVTTDIRNCGIYTFRAHGQIYHNIRSFGKEDGHEPGHLELYFYNNDPSLEHRLRKCCEKSAQEDREVIQRLKDILHGINPYSENLRSMGQVDNLEDYHVELNLDQWLDQRTYNVPLTSEVATVWIEGSECWGQFDDSVVLQGKDRSIHGIRSYHGCYDALSYPLFFSRGELGWHNCIPKVGVTMAEVNKA
ncbi:uncharacterized protein LOC101753102 isoform X2 [Setaria italica]|uniref:uncharacterized protein LOC101753102 isoform X2 n=1 Tax=Setaria italica TaxID=4555 RepID=UPI000647F726|nr:uncharacterized protein LOC101753102 isoform X2 [Setaria italica]